MPSRVCVYVSVLFKVNTLSLSLIRVKASSEYTVDTSLNISRSSGRQNRGDGNVGGFASVTDSSNGEGFGSGGTVAVLALSVAAETIAFVLYSAARVAFI